MDTPEPTPPPPPPGPPPHPGHPGHPGPPGHPHAPPPYVPRPGDDPRQRVIDHLRLLSTFTYVLAGFQGLGVLFGLVYVVMGLVFVYNPPGQGAGAGASQSGQPPPDWFGWVFVGSGGFVVLLCGVMIALTVMAARDLARHRRRVFCIVIAALHCLGFPGIVLGILTIIVLCKPEAVALFEENKR